MEGSKRTVEANIKDASSNKFSKENSLQVGDDCCFELIEKENYVFKVSIARRIDNSTPTKA
ncbi:hypothetical protein LguiA_013446 [Lonicera macranthoides]